jgi:hypothetical protein
MLGTSAIWLLALLSLLSTSGIAPSVRYGSALNPLQSANSLRPDALRILGLIPREPTPPPLEERPEDELSPEELLQLVKQFKVCRQYRHTLPRTHHHRIVMQLRPRSRKKPLSSASGLMRLLIPVMMRTSRLWGRDTGSVSIVGTKRLSCWTRSVVWSWKKFLSDEHNQGMAVDANWVITCF